VCTHGRAGMTTFHLSFFSQQAEYWALIKIGCALDEVRPTAIAMQAANVLLASSDQDRRGWIGKVLLLNPFH